MSDPTRFAPPGSVWQCAACGKVSDLDLYGIEGRYDYGWDESCMLNAVLVDADKHQSAPAKGDKP